MNGERRGGPSTAMLLQMVTQNHQTAEEGHRRLREDLREMEKEIDKLVARQEAAAKLHDELSAKFSRFESTPLNVDKVTFSGRQLAVIVGACLSIAVGMWSLKVSVDGVQGEIKSTAKLQDERNATTNQALDQLRANLEMRRVEIQNLSNFIQQNVAPATRQGARQ